MFFHVKSWETAVSQSFWTAFSAWSDRRKSGFCLMGVTFFVPHVGHRLEISEMLKNRWISLVQIPKVHPRMRFDFPMSNQRIVEKITQNLSESQATNYSRPPSRQQDTLDTCLKSRSHEKWKFWTRSDEDGYKKFWISRNMVNFDICHRPEDEFSGHKLWANSRRFYPVSMHIIP